MPTILFVNGYAFRIYTADHGPAHVHVLRRGSGSMTLLLPMLEPLSVQGLSQTEVRAAVEIAHANAATLLAAWNTYHGSKH